MKFAVSVSTDSGKTLVSAWSAPSKQKDLPWLSPSVVDRIAWIPMELDDGGYGSLLSLPIATGKTTASIHRFNRRAEKACAFGPRVVVRWTASEWGLSRDAGDSFSPIPAARNGGPEEELKCSKHGAQYGSRFLAWE